MSLIDSLRRIYERFMAMSMGQRTALLAALGLAVAILVVTIMWGMQPKYQYLFTDLTTTDASQIVQRLKDDRIPYRLSKGGTAIEIPEKLVYETRLELSAQGLPKGGVGKGFSLFDETSFSATEFVQKINYQRALEDELARTIMSLSEINHARVHIVLPKESVFIEDEKPAKASIVVRPRGDKRLSQAQVQGIVHLVAKSVRGLEPENISIVDVTGKVLYEGKDKDDALTVATSRLEIRRALENSLESRAQEIVEKVVGPGAAIIKISAELNMDVVKSLQDSYDPEGQVTRSEELRNEFNAENQGAGGIAGTQSNLPTGRGGPTPIPAGAKSGSSNVIRNYEVTTTKTEHIQAPGEIKRLSVSVVVDGTYKTGDDGKRTFVPRLPEEMSDIENAVKQAVGFNADREDLISVSCMQFAQGEELPPPTTKEKILAMLMTAWKPILMLIVIFFIFFTVIRPLMRWLMSSQARVVSRKEAEQQALSAEDRKALAAKGEEVQAVDEATVKSEEMRAAVQGQRKMIQDMAKSDVESATAVVKSWLQEPAP